MLSPDEEGFLSKIPDDKLVFVHSFDPEIPKIAEEITQKIHSAVADLEVTHMGASALGISGQGDIDIYIFSDPEKFDEYIPVLIPLFGEPKSIKYDSVAWKYKEDGHEIEMYLTDPTSPSMQKQIKIFETLQNNEDLLNEYEKLKEEMNGKPFKEYQRRKYEFYHKILDR